MFKISWKSKDIQKNPGNIQKFKDIPAQSRHVPNFWICWWLHVRWFSPSLAKVLPISFPRKFQLVATPSTHPADFAASHWVGKFRWNSCGASLMFKKNRHRGSEIFENSPRGARNLQKIARGAPNIFRKSAAGPPKSSKNGPRGGGSLQTNRPRGPNQL